MNATLAVYRVLALQKVGVQLRVGEATALAGYIGAGEKTATAVAKIVLEMIKLAEGLTGQEVKAAFPTDWVGLTSYLVDRESECYP